MTDLSTLVARLSPEGRAALARELGAAAGEPIALVGIGCRYPGGVTSPESFWRLLVEGRDAITEVPADRWDVAAFHSDDPRMPGRMPVLRGGFLGDVAGFDAAFFGISPREAEAMDPQQRLLLEVAWEALEHAGVPPRSLAGSRTGVFVGMGAHDYLVERVVDPTTREDPHTLTGGSHSTAVGRLSYVLDLHGPSVSMDTGCSGSLVALHMGCQSLRAGEADLVLAGGVKVICSPHMVMTLIRGGGPDGGAIAPDARCRTFDADATGMVRSEGCGVVVLERLSDAVRRGHRVLALIRGSAVNQDGRSNGLLAPSAVAQRALFAETLARAGVAGADVGLVETHGTGTRLGDPIEVEALGPVYGAGDRGACALGAVKTNLGHAEEAAGMAGLIKAVLCLGHGEIPANLHFRTLNPDITLDGTRFVVPVERMDWPVAGGPRLAAVSAFGWGGTNAHVVLEEGPSPAAPSPGPDGPVLPREGGGIFLVPLSSGTREGLREEAARLRAWLPRAGSLRDVGYTLGRRRSHLQERLVVVAGSVEDLERGLGEHLEGTAGAWVASGSARAQARDGVVWVFSGHGSQWAGMGAELLDEEPAFRAVVEELEPVVADEAGFSLLETLRGADVPQPYQHQPAIYAMQLGLCEVWKAHGVRPAAVMGHSMGEITAAVVAGALTREAGARAICRRGRLMQERLAGKGTMALVELGEEETERRLGGREGISVAVSASPRATVVSGTVEAVDALVAECEAEGLMARRIRGAEAGHGPLVEPLMGELRRTLSWLEPEAPAVTFYSTALEDPRARAAFDPDYWATNLRRPVRLAAAVRAAAEDGHRMFVEVSPHPVVERSLAETLEEAEVEGWLVAWSLRREQPARRSLLTQLGRLHCHGLEVDWERLHPDGRQVDLPVRAWQHRRYWPHRRRGGAQGGHPLLGTHVRLPWSGEHLWQGEVSVEALPWLGDHRTEDGLAVMPGTGWCEMALSAAAQGMGVGAEQVVLRELDFQRLLVLDRPVTITTTLRRAGAREGVVEIATADGAERLVHATVRVHLREPEPAPRVSLAAAASAHPVALDAASVYARMRRSGQYHGPAFTGLEELLVTSGSPASALSRVAWPAAAVRDPHFALHPAFLDVCLHAAMGLVREAPGELYLPAGLGELRVWGDVARVTHCLTRVRASERDGGHLATIRLLDGDGRVQAELTDLYLRAVDESRLPVSVHDKLYERRWEPEAAPEGEPAAGRWLLLGAAPTPGPLQRELAGTLAAVSACWRDEAAVARALTEVAGGQIGVVLLAFADEPAEDPQAEAETRVLAAARVAVLLADAAPAGAGRLWIVTRGAEQVADTEAPDLPQAGLRGLGRTLVFEHPELRPTLLDLDPGTCGIDHLVAELAAGRDDEVAWRGGTRFVGRLRQVHRSPVEPAAPFVRPGGGYIVTAGLTGLGLYTAAHLAERGAGCLVLNARSAPSPEAEAAMAAMRSAGARVVVVQGDVAEPGTAERLVAAVVAAGAPLRGVLHAAAWLHDSLVENLDAAGLRTPWRPKAAGAWRLHEATAGLDLDWWVGYSSIASLLGNPGQANYAAASAWLDGLVRWRRARGLPGLSVNWGPWAEVGRAGDRRHAAIGLLRPREGLRALEELIVDGRRQTGVARIHAGVLTQSFPEARGSSFLAGIAAPAGGAALEGDGWPGPAALAGLSGDALRQAVSGRIRAQISAVMGFGDADLPPDQPIVQLGMDSLMAVRIRNAIQADLGLALPVTALLQGLSVSELELEVVARLDGGPAPAAVALEDARRRGRARAARRVRR